MTVSGGYEAEPKGLNPIEDGDMDSLFTLPLSFIPLKTPALRQARMIKNAQLRSVIELFSDVQTGSGQIEISDLPKLLNWPTDEVHPDHVIIRKLSTLHSYDVFSLRIMLRKIGVPLANAADLQLSPEKNQELTHYMTQFTRPLIAEIYGGEDVQVERFEDVVGLFRDPDIKRARQRLQQMADALGIEILEVPTFLEDYGDIFLSLSYYKQCLDRLTPLLDVFLASMYDIRKNYQLRQDQNLLRNCDMIENTINELTAAITGRFENFERSTKAMWEDISADRFQKVKELIQAYHVTIGGVLCGLTVKMNAWIRLFPKPTTGGPVKRSEFIMSDIRQGLDNITKIEDSAPMMALLS
ncbi:hypothetical protein F1188_12340 [Roseospira marina]|uniref:Uncharacterized protein n=1 Tax=Roseospira marina TaxID=140057 RepID=A0A5M6I9Z2_9PROT|nr:hypothetical protein [Roseospira marina]KAA5605070.1 hypothetical protein F1188_12340 [Roseospira marina]MBB4314815.1 hypothetical protein [Roseospira marina]MBB5087815.1 hypothetical protein [Roseospira marina]